MSNTPKDIVPEDLGPIISEPLVQTLLKTASHTILLAKLLKYLWELLRSVNFSVLFSNIAKAYIPA